jgi:hypothetical protein
VSSREGSKNRSLASEISSISLIRNYSNSEKNPWLTAAEATTQMQEIFNGVKKEMVERI